MNVPGVRMADLQEGVLGIQWIDGKSVRFLLGGGAEGEEEIEEVEGDDFEEESDNPEEDPLLEYKITQGKCYIIASCSRPYHRNHTIRRHDALDWQRDCQNAQGRYHSRRPHHLQYDAPTTFRPRSPVRTCTS